MIARMGDKVFEWSLCGLTALVIIWIILGIAFHVLSSVAVILIGVFVEIVIGALLLHIWNKGYLERTEKR